MNPLEQTAMFIVLSPLIFLWIIAIALVRIFGGQKPAARMMGVNLEGHEYDARKLNSHKSEQGQDDV